MSEVLHTKFGNAKINDSYLKITSWKEGNNGKRLHRLIFEEYHDCKLDKNDVIHHIDGDKLNNHPANLICMSKKAHQLLHNRGRKHSEESKRKISESNKGKTYSDEYMENQSKSHTSTGFFKVTKHKNSKCKQGFTWEYHYFDKDKKKYITSVSLLKLKEAVLKKRLKWVVVDIDKAYFTCKEYSYNFKELVA